ncbi:hypothetical protein P8452_61251 [Trifolium repens]|nr:hypothetical protein P8452_61251 [Trifolium repens]
MVLAFLFPPSLELVHSLGDPLLSRSSVCSSFRPAPSLNVSSCGREVPGESMLSAETGLEAFEKPLCSFLPIEWRQSD